MGNWDFTATVQVYDESPLLDCLYEYAEVECEVWVKCDLYFGYEGGYIEPPEDSRASIEEVEVTDIRFLPHDKDDVLGELKIKFLTTEEMRSEIERLALKKLKDGWNEKYSAEAFKTYTDYYSDGPDHD
jgi:hypothetical protein